jgi:DNA-binding transcriptional LysR family regulator
LPPPAQWIGRTAGSAGRLRKVTALDEEMLKLNQIETFIAVVKHKSFSAAAVELNITQPRVSARIQELEEVFGFRLIDRHARPLVLTPSGELIFPKCSEIVDLVRSVEGIAATITEKDAPRIRMGAIALHAWRRWRVLESFMTRYPDYCLEIESGSSAGLADRLLHGEVDIAFIHGRTSPKIEELRLLHARYGLIQPSGRLRHCAVLHLEDLRDSELALFRRELAPAIYDEIFPLLEMHGIRTVEVPEVTDEGILNFVQCMQMPVLSFKSWDESRPPEGISFQEIADMEVGIDFVMARAGIMSAAADRLWRHCASSLG